MKYSNFRLTTLAVALVAACTLATACTTRTAYGDCVGITDDHNPDIRYKVSGWNIAMALVFVETVVVPVVVVVDDFQCPVGRKAAVTKDN